MATDGLLAVELVFGGDEATLWVDGELDISTAHLVEDGVAVSAEHRGIQTIMVDLRGVSFCDGAGLRAVIRGRESASDRGLRCAIRPSPAVQRIAEAVGSRMTDDQR